MSVAPKAGPIAIIGAGMSGLGLAVALRDLGRPVDVYEAAAEPPSERTFCGFEVEPHLFAAAVSHRWSVIETRGSLGPSRSTLRRHPYAMIPGPRFVARAFELLADAPHVRLHVDTPVDDPLALRAAHVFDSRPVAPAPDALLQVFRGRFVRTEAPAFEPGVATLMDFEVDQSLGVHFVYVLPTSRTEALVEDTYFTTETIGDLRFEATLDRWLERVGPHDVVATEGGTIPMSTAAPPPPPEGVTRIGLAGGVAKPSTGYAFLFAQRHARAIARALAEGRPPPGTVRSATDRFLDQVFLERLRAEPERGHLLFQQLLSQNEGDRIARFLSECASPRDTLAVMSSLPFGAFTRQAIRTIAKGALGSAAPLP